MVDADDAAALAFLEKEGKEFDKVSTISQNSFLGHLLITSRRTQRSIAF